MKSSFVLINILQNWKVIKKVLENWKVKDTDFKNCIYCYFNEIIKLEIFDFDSISIDEKSCKSILVYWVLGSIK